MIAVLGGLADLERDPIRTRTAEGRPPREARAAHGPISEAELRRKQEQDFAPDGLTT